MTVDSHNTSIINTSAYLSNVSCFIENQAPIRLPQKPTNENPRKEFAISRSSDNNLHIVHLNAQSARNKKGFISAFLQSVNCDIFCICEHWLTNDEISSFSLDGFNLCAFSTRKTRRGGGTAIFYRSPSNIEIQAATLQIACVEEIFEYCAVSTTVNNQRYLIISLYRSPHASTEEFFHILHSLLDASYKKDNTIIICADTNINLLCNNHISSRLLDILGSYDIKPSAKEPTRISKISRTLIDNIFTNYSNCVSESVESGFFYKNALGSRRSQKQITAKEVT